MNHEQPTVAINHTDHHMRGRRPKYGGAKMQWQSIVLPTATAEALKAAAFQSNVSFSELVRGLLADGIKYQMEVRE